MGNRCKDTLAGHEIVGITRQAAATWADKACNLDTGGVKRQLLPNLLSLPEAFAAVWRGEGSGTEAAFPVKEAGVKECTSCIRD